MEVPGLESEVYFGDAEAPPPDWRAVLSEDEPDPEDDPENAATATAMLGFDPVSLWEESAEEVDAEPQTKSLENHKFGCLLLPLAEPDAKEVTDWIIENVHDEHLAPDGRCLRSHVTVLYGFKDCDEEQLHRIESILTRHGPVEAKFGDAVSAFPEGKDGVPLKVDLISPQFEALNAVLREEFFDQVEITHPDFQPHLTLAYLLPGTEKFYLDAKPPFLGKKLSLGMAEFSSPDKVRTQIRLSWLPMLKHIDADDRVIKDNPMPSAHRMIGREQNPSGNRIGMFTVDDDKALPQDQIEAVVDAVRKNDRGHNMAEIGDVRRELEKMGLSRSQQDDALTAAMRADRVVGSGREGRFGVTGQQRGDEMKVRGEQIGIGYLSLRKSMEEKAIGDDPYFDGYQAGMEGKPRHNPHQGDDARKWDAGWRNATDSRPEPDVDDVKRMVTCSLCGKKIDEDYDHGWLGGDAVCPRCMGWEGGKPDSSVVEWYRRQGEWDKRRQKPKSLKAMSYLNDVAGGALVPPPEQGEKAQISYLPQTTETWWFGYRLKNDLEELLMMENQDRELLERERQN